MKAVLAINEESTRRRERENEIGHRWYSDFNPHHLWGNKAEEHGEVKGATELDRRLMAISEEDRQSVFRKILAFAKERCVEITGTFYQQKAKQWNVRCRGGPPNTS